MLGQDYGALTMVFRGLEQILYGEMGGHLRTRRSSDQLTTSYSNPIRLRASHFIYNCMVCLR